MRPDELKKNIAANIQEVMKKAGAAAVCFGFVTELAEAAFKAIVPEPSEPDSDVTAESCTLSALAKHIEVFRQENSGIDPHVLVKVNGQWCPVRANIEATGEHRNAVAIEYLPGESQ